MTETTDRPALYCVRTILPSGRVAYSEPMTYEEAARGLWTGTRRTIRVRTDVVPITEVAR